MNLTKECDHLEKLIWLKENEISRLRNGIEIEKWNLNGCHWRKVLEEKPTMNNLEKELEVLNMRFHASYLQALKEKQVIEDMINSLSDPMERTLMRLRYIESLEWKDVGNKINCNKEYARLIHWEILENFNECKSREKNIKFNFKTYTNLTRECDHLEKLIAKKTDELEKFKSSLMPLKVDVLEKEVEALNMKFHENYLQALKEKQVIEDMIDSLNDPMERTLMRLRYIECLEWKNIYMEIDYSRTQTYKIHKRILEKIEKNGDKHEQ